MIACKGEKGTYQLRFSSGDTLRTTTREKRKNKYFCILYFLVELVELITVTGECL